MKGEGREGCSLFTYRDSIEFSSSAIDATQCFHDRSSVQECVLNRVWCTRRQDHPPSHPGDGEAGFLPVDDRATFLAKIFTGQYQEVMAPGPPSCGMLYYNIFQSRFERTKLPAKRSFRAATFRCRHRQYRKRVFPAIPLLGRRNAATFFQTADVEGGSFFLVVINICMCSIAMLSEENTRTR